VLGDFASKRQEGVTRVEYVSLLAEDLQQVYGYNGELVELLLQLFSPAEVRPVPSDPHAVAHAGHVHVTSMTRP